MNGDPLVVKDNRFKLNQSLKHRKISSKLIRFCNVVFNANKYKRAICYLLVNFHCMNAYTKYFRYDRCDYMYVAIRY